MQAAAHVLRHEPRQRARLADAAAERARVARHGADARHQVRGHRLGRLRQAVYEEPGGRRVGACPAAGRRQRAFLPAHSCTADRPQAHAHSTRAGSATPATPGRKMRPGAHSRTRSLSACATGARARISLHATKEVTSNFGIMRRCTLSAVVRRAAAAVRARRPRGRAGQEQLRRHHARRQVVHAHVAHAAHLQLRLRCKQPRGLGLWFGAGLGSARADSGAGSPRLVPSAARRGAGRVLRRAWRAGCQRGGRTL